MNTRKSIKYGKNIKIIHAGEYYVSMKDELIGTILGPCVSVCLHDSKKKISGMNHYMLPGKISSRDILRDKAALYGITSINKLISKMEKAGSRKIDMSAKVFGGGRVYDNISQINNLPQDNVRVALILLEVEDIPILERDVGRKYTRKLLFDAKSGKVYLRRTVRDQVFDDYD